MARTHMKRISSPRTWPIKKKTTKWIAKPQGSHSLDNGMSVYTLFKEVLKLAKSSTEVNNILFHKKILLNGRELKTGKRTFGLFDVLSIPDTKTHYTLILNQLKKLDVKEIDEKESKTKLGKVVGKKYLGTKKIQINFHDGSNKIVEKDDYKVGDTLVLNLPDHDVKEKMALDKNSLVYIMKGRHTGSTGHVEKFEDGDILCKTNQGDLKLAKEEIFVIGKEKPALSFFDVKQKKSESKKDTKKEDDNKSKKESTKKPKSSSKSKESEKKKSSK